MDAAIAAAAAPTASVQGSHATKETKNHHLSQDRGQKRSRDHTTQGDTAVKRSKSARKGKIKSEGAWDLCGLRVVRAGKKVRDAQGEISVLKYSVVKDNSSEKSKETLGAVGAALRTAFVLIATMRLWGVDSARRVEVAADINTESAASSFLPLVALYSNPNSSSFYDMCYTAVRSLKHCLQKDMQKNSRNDQCALAALSIASPGRPGAVHLKHIERSIALLCPRTSSASSSHPIKGNAICITALTLICALDGLYMELLPVAAAVAASVGGSLNGIIPDPADYLMELYRPLMNDTQLLKLRSSNPLEHYLHMRNNVEAPLFNLPTTLAYAASIGSGLHPGPDEGTMRGSDPIGTDICNLYWDVCRDRVAQWAAFACPNKEVLQLIAKFVHNNDIDNSISMKNMKTCDIVEIGAGTGYWATYLRQQVGLRVCALDKRPAAQPSKGNGKYTALSSASRSSANIAASMNEYHGTFSSWTSVQKGTEIDLRGLSSIPSRIQEEETNIFDPSLATALFLCYPPPNDTMALQALKNFKGNKIIYIGELWGDTGTRSFQSELSKNWCCIETYSDLPQFGNTSYIATMWQRQNNTNKEKVVKQWPIRCAACDKALGMTHIPNGSTEADVSLGTPFLRDRLTRCVHACNKTCAMHIQTYCGYKKEVNHDKQKSALQLECIKRHMDDVLEYVNKSESDLTSIATLWSTVKP